MSSQITFNEIAKAIRQVGVKAGDIIMVHSRLFTIGLVREAASVSEIPGIYLRAFREVLEDAGTIVVPTFTTSFGRFGKPFIYETSPSEMGIFSETVRRTVGSRRTLHPIQSLTALGAQAEVLTKDHPPWNVGYDTIWDRLLHRGAKAVALGIPFRQGLSVVHHIEFLACVPYIYPKILSGEVYVGGIRIPDKFFLAARYLQYEIFYDLSMRVEPDLADSSAAMQVPLGGEWIQMVPMEVVFEVCMKGLRKDPYYLLEKPPLFVEGRPPCDGTTYGREGVLPSYFEVLR